MRISLVLCCCAPLLGCTSDNIEAEQPADASATPISSSQSQVQTGVTASSNEPSDYDIEKIKQLVERNPWFAELERWERNLLIKCVSRKIEADQFYDLGTFWPSYHDDIHAGIDDIGRRNFEPYEQYCPDLIAKVRILI